MRRRKIDGCPIAGALQMIGDKWTLLVARDLAAGPKRTMELHTGLFPISSRTLVARLRDMEKDRLIERTDFGGNPPHIEYALTERGLLLLPLVDALRVLGQSLDCNECEDRKKHLGFYCEACPRNFAVPRSEPLPRPAPSPRRQRDDSIVLL
ncbi:MAG TPA: transcriptional regulator [Blastocatellia bacterium]|nr:transcriptional regulator [Blastocatellia bacterium]HAF22335.1 transcriptional regulator [Blastocatellia bacterium]HCX30484.1 transcriptional regulator [Blastocatellia bacterium]